MGGQRGCGHQCVPVYGLEVPARGGFGQVLPHGAGELGARHFSRAHEGQVACVLLAVDQRQPLGAAQGDQGRQGDLGAVGDLGEHGFAEYVHCTAIFAINGNRSMVQPLKRLAAFVLYAPLLERRPSATVTPMETIS